MFFATEEVNAAQVAIGNLRERTEHRVDDGGLVAARGAVAANTDLRETNAARFLQNVADISKRTIERVDRGIRLPKIAHALLAALNGVLKNSDRRSANRVLTWPTELLPAGKPNLHQQQLAIGRLNAAKRNSRRQKVRYAGKIGRNCAHGYGSDEGAQVACHERH